MKLNLGSADSKINGFLNIDIRNVPGVDVVADVAHLPFKDNSIDECIAYNILEHFAPDRIHAVLKEWHRVLKPGGKLRVGVPDGELIFDRYKKGILPPVNKKPGWEGLVHSLFGNMKELRQRHGEEAEKYMHHMLFSEDYLKKCLAAAGFTNFKKIKPNHPDNVTLECYKK